jgi:D-ribulokinase
MEKDLGSLVALYVAGLCGLGYGLRQIVEIQAANGAPVEAIAISGGAGRHPLIRQVLADATGLPVIATRSEEPVLLGSAMLAAVAAGSHKDVRSAMSAMSSHEKIYEPAGGAIADWHRTRFTAFGKLQLTAREIAG